MGDLGGLASRARLVTGEFGQDQRSVRAAEATDPMEGEPRRTFVLDGMKEIERTRGQR